MKTCMLTVFALVAPLSLMAEANMSQESQSQIPEINGTQLKEWYRKNAPMIVLDARCKENFKGGMLPGAKWLSADTSTDEEIRALLPSKDTLIVTYCCDQDCQASRRLAVRLKAMGYNHVYIYTGGLTDWLKKQAQN